MLLFLKKEAQSTAPVAHIRRAIIQDAPAIAALSQEITSVEERAVKTTAKSLQSDIFNSDGHGSFLVAENGDGIVGFVLYYPGYDLEHASWGNQVGYVLVREDHRRQGLARAMLAALETVTKEEGGAWVSWTVPSSYHFAQRLHRSIEKAHLPADFQSLSVTSFRIIP